VDIVTSMDRGLLARALIIGFVCFIIAIVVFCYQSLMVEQSNRPYTEMIGAVSDNSDGIGSIGLLMLIVLGSVVLMLVAGLITTLSSSQYWDRPGDIFRASALAGGTAIMLFWIIFWCLIMANIVRGAFNHEPFGSGDLLFLVCVLGINALTVGLGGLLAGLAGKATRALARGMARQSG
jgi:hypothetical protein